ncbi:hypothetical protein [Haloarcula nitratireducens]|uniref:Uncharacterized protein n=1 Tax=Haloarcula nitratireducens TaxID=2487749 RepID=A0AAW4P9I2_9EURY|nr:hypothetical protein [Halomicroarcula nitratireducens]MBX0294602.1 hypothetical protein [Halomicroarcula nitratireducens]
MDRRRFLATAGSLLPTAAAGCLSGGAASGNDAAYGVAELPAARIAMTPVEDVALAERVTYSVDESEDRAELLDRILDGGATVERTRPPLPEGRHINYRDAVYVLDHEVVETTPGTTYSVRVDIPQETVTDSRSVGFSALPAVDRERFAAKGLADGDPVGVGTAFHYTDAETEASVLVPESEYEAIVWESGSKAEWAVDDSYDAPLYAYEYAVEEVATVAEYGRRMREAVAFELTDLTSAQREVVEAAISTERGYSVGPDETVPDAVRSLIERFRDQKQAHALDGTGEDDLNGRYLVGYDGAVYWTRLSIREARLPTATAAE